MRRRHLNPVLAREMKERVRDRRATVTLTMVLGLLALVVQLVYWTQRRNTSANNPFSVPQSLSSATTGRMLFEVIVLVLVVMLCFIVPGLAAAAIAGERDRQTLVPLQITLLRPSSILAGKLASALVYLLFVIVATAPLLGISLVLGGVTAMTVARAVLAVMFVATVLGSLAVMCSVVFRRVQVATVAAYFLSFTLLFGSPIAFAVQRVIVTNLQSNNSGARNNRLMLTLNPVVLVAEAVNDASTQASGSSSPLSSIHRGISDLSVRFDANGQQVATGSSTIPFWLWCVVVQAALAALAFWAATKRLRTPSERSVDR